MKRRKTALEMLGNAVQSGLNKREARLSATKGDSLEGKRLRGDGEQDTAESPSVEQPQPSAKKAKMTV